MTITDFTALLGGLALFLYGMSMMSAGLERVSGGRLEAVLEKLTGNLVKSILLGMCVTAAIQSSSATTVIVVGLVNAGIMKLRQAIGVIMGANIGTTITAHLLSLSELDGSIPFLNALKPSSFTPILAFAGILIYLVSKRESRKSAGQLLLGLSILFTGMFAMESAVSALGEMEGFTELFATLQNPILGVLAGLAVTAVIQSSSASVGILQALASTGSITFASAFPIIMGQNIGTCITPVLASTGASRGAKRTAFIHVSFNVSGTVFFLIAIYAIQGLIGFPFWGEAITKSGIATFHTVFNVISTLLFLPFTALLEKAAYFFIRPAKDEIARVDEATRLDDRFLSSPAFAIQQARHSVVRMAQLSKDNLLEALTLLQKFDRKKLDELRAREDEIDRLQSKVDIYLLKVAQRQPSDTENTLLAEVLHAVNEFERIGDHANNIGDQAELMHNNKTSFSPDAVAELNVLTGAVKEILDDTIQGYAGRDVALAERIEPLEEVIDTLTDTLKFGHGQRLQAGLCTLDSAFPYVDILTDLERIADHCSNIGVHIMCYGEASEQIDRHAYLRELHHANAETYRAHWEQYETRYFGMLSSLGVQTKAEEASAG